MLVTFRVKNIVSFCVKKLLHFALKSCYILRQKLLHFGLMLHFASKVVTFRVNVTFCVNCYILWRNIASYAFSELLDGVRDSYTPIPHDKVLEVMLDECHANRAADIFVLEESSKGDIVL